MKTPREFLFCESGSTAVEWVVLSAGVLGVAIAGITLISDGMEENSYSIVSEIQDVAPSYNGRSAESYITAAIANYPDDRRRALLEVVRNIRNAAPNGYRFTGRIDVATGQPVFVSGDGSRYMVGGSTISRKVYRRKDAPTVEVGGMI